MIWSNVSFVLRLEFHLAPWLQAMNRASGLERSSRMNKITMAAMDAVEIKLTIRPDQELRGRALELNEDTADVRLIYFYDTPDLDLFNAGVVLRARLVKDDADDSTVKFRPVEASKISKRVEAIERVQTGG